MENVQHILRAAPCMVLSAAVLAWLVSGNALYARFTAYFILTDLMTKGIKQLLLPLGTTRPLNAGYGQGCGCFPTNKVSNVDQQPGMPSGHASTVMMAATFWSLRVSRQSKNASSKVFRIFVLFLLAMLVSISRVVFENCHTWPQVIVGMVVGVGLGFAFDKIEQGFF